MPGGETPAQAWLIFLLFFRNHLYGFQLTDFLSVKPGHKKCNTDNDNAYKNVIDRSDNKAYLSESENGEHQDYDFISEESRSQ
jgi:hypothetical protein